MNEALTFTLDYTLQRTFQACAPTTWQGLMKAAIKQTALLDRELPSEEYISYMMMFSPKMRTPDPQEVQRQRRQAVNMRDQSQAVVCGACYMALTNPTQPLTQSSIEQAYNLGRNLLTIGTMSQNPNKLGDGGVPLSRSQKNFLQMLSVPTDVEVDSAMAAVDLCGELPNRKDMKNRRGLGNFQTLLRYVQIQPDLPL